MEMENQRGFVVEDRPFGFVSSGVFNSCKKTMGEQELKKTELDFVGSGTGFSGGWHFLGVGGAPGSDAGSSTEERAY